MNVIVLDRKAVYVIYHLGFVDASCTLKVRDVTCARLEHSIWMLETKEGANHVLVMAMVQSASQLKDSFLQTLLPTLLVCVGYARVWPAL